MAKRYRSTTTRIVAIACFAFSFFLAPIAEAACSSLMPAPQTFYGDRGQLDRPFVVPGDHAGGGNWVTNGGRVTLTLASCPPAPPNDQFDQNSQVVALVFTPPGGRQRNALLLAANCDGVDVNACSSQLGGGTARCARTTFVATDSNTRLFFDVPATTSVGLPDLTGPATIVVTTKASPGCALGGPIANCKAASLQTPAPIFCVDDLYQGSCSSSPHPEFGNFTVLPELNDYKSLCRDKGDKPSCASADSLLQLAIDKRGNALIPIKWVGVLRGKGNPNSDCPSSTNDDACDKRKFAGYTGINAFPGGSAPINLPAGAAVKSYNMRGGEFERDFTITASQTDDGYELRLEGVAHKPKSVLRLPNRDPENPEKQLFNFADRMKDGVGSILLGQSEDHGVCTAASGADEDPPTAPRAQCGPKNPCKEAGRVCASFRAFARGY